MVILALPVRSGTSASVNFGAGGNTSLKTLTVSPQLDILLRIDILRL
jgi:hypothetical protein